MAAAHSESVPSWPKLLQNISLKQVFLLYFRGLSLVCFSSMQSVFAIITNKLPLKLIFVKRVFVIILAGMVLD